MQYPEWARRRNRVVTSGNGIGQHGPGKIPVNQVHRWNIHPQVAVAEFYRMSPYFAVEAVRQFGLNVVGFHLATGAQRWYIIGCYLAPNDTLMIEIVVAAPKELPQGAALMVAGDLNTTLTEPENDQRGTEIAMALTEE